MILLFHSFEQLKAQYEILKELGERQPHKMVKHIQTICWLLATNCLSVFDYFVGFEPPSLLTNDFPIIKSQVLRLN